VISCYAGTATLPDRRAVQHVRPSVRTIPPAIKSLDLQVTKNFEIGDLGSMYLRIERST
jgi:hypothetical protein